ncbi:MAG: acyltransferase [Muribaculaceae bacterium]|nr:acyltransferase [Muribaculaceae bacterium]
MKMVCYGFNISNRLCDKMKNINYWKTLFYNYHFWGLKGLLKLPLIVHSGVVFKDISGKIILTEGIKKGTLRLGSAQPLATRDMQYDRAIIDISGVLIVCDNVHIAPGCRISVNTGATLEIGKNFNSTGNCTIICDKRISIGNSCLFSWDIQLMDSDFHKIFNSENKCINMPERIEIGDDVWIGCRSTILKGSRIPKGCIVGARSVVAGKFVEENSIIGGVGKGCQVLKSNIHWEP